MPVRTERFRNSFFPFCLSQWNKLDSHLRDLPSLHLFKRALFQFFRPVSRSVFRNNDFVGLTLLTRLRVGLSHPCEHKFRHNFLDTTDPFCSCRTNSIETTEHYLLHCPNYSLQRSALFSDLNNHHLATLPYHCSALCQILLYGGSQFADGENKAIISEVIKYIIATGRFHGSIFN